MAGRGPYRLLLLLFPAALRERHGNEMARLLADRCRDARRGVSRPRGALRVAGLWILAIRDAVHHGLVARLEARRPPAKTSRRSAFRGGSSEGFGAARWHDLRHAARGLGRSAGFTAVALATLALGIGASTTIFTLVNALILRPLAVAEPGRLTQVTIAGTGVDTDRFTNPQWEALRDRQSAFEGVFATADVYLGTGPEDDVGRERVRGAWVSGGFFSTLGLRPSAGRLLGAGDDVRGCPAVAVVGHGYWRHRAGADPEIVGRAIRLEGHPFEIVGVVEPGFAGMTVEAATDVYLPLCAEAIVRGEHSTLDARNTWILQVVGRRPQGAGLSETRAALEPVVTGVLADTVPRGWEGDRRAGYLSGTVELEAAASGFSPLRARYRRALLVLLGGVGAVLLVVCGNLANLLLARTSRRRGEIAMRIALGASGRRLLAQSLTESLLLAVLGAIAGLIVARWTSDLLVALISTPDAPVTLDVAPDHRVLLFATALAIATGLLFGVAPALHARRVSPQAAIKGTGEAGRPASLRTGGVLVALQVTFSLVLLTGATLLVGTFWRLATLDPGFDRERVILADTEILVPGLEPEQQRQAFLDLLERLRATPGVQAASFAELTPLEGFSITEFVVRAGFESLLDEDAEVFLHRVGDDYFAAMGAAVLDGRGIDATDGPGSEPVAVLSESAARLVFGDAGVVGRSLHLRLGEHEVSEPIRVVGVVRDAKLRSLRDENTATIYTALRQQPPFFWGSTLTFQVLPEIGVRSLEPAIHAVLEDGPMRTRAQTTLLSDRLSASVARERLLALIATFFASLTLFLAVVGLYGVMSFHVSRRLHEIGIRMALGAGESGVFALVLRQAARPVLFGVVLGALGSLAAVRAIASLLYGVSPHDVRVLVASAALLTGGALASAALPARRASRADPAVVLRCGTP
ncbi:MAG TPA: ABC transporter permease [Thermoanaerobaculia bacterium]|nr:ABC transporter permease [Thermoanaerobaculia bacterium]